MSGSSVETKGVGDGLGVAVGALVAVGGTRVGVAVELCSVGVIVSAGSGVEVAVELRMVAAMVSVSGIGVGVGAPCAVAAEVPSGIGVGVVVISRPADAQPAASHIANTNNNDRLRRLFILCRQRNKKHIRCQATGQKKPGFRKKPGF